MFKKNSEQAESLDQPLLDRPDDDDLREGGNAMPPIATTVGILGVGAIKSKGYARVVDADDSERAEEEARERAARMNKLALEKQHNNQAHFEQDMKDLEERVVREAKERARIEENDRLLALRLQQELGGTPGTSTSPAMIPATTTMMVTVPVDARGGQMISVQVPGHGNIKIMVPRGLKAGDQFNFKIPVATAPVTHVPSLVPQRIVQQVVVRVPRGAAPSGSFRVILPTNRVLVVGVPAGVREGDMIRVQYDETSGMPNTDPALNPTNYMNDQQEESMAIQQSMEQVQETDAERAEREAFLSALPEDVRREVLAQETAQKRRLGAFARGEPLAPEQVPAPSSAEAPLSQEQIELLTSLPAELRAEVERDMRAENARQVRPPPGGPRTPPRAAPVAPPPAPPRSGEADLLDFSSFGSYSPQSAPPAVAATSPSGGPSQAPMDMFQNLSVRGVNKDAKNSRLQQI